MRLFITGTDTGAGKTYVSTGLVRAARADGHDCVGLKPFCCGGREDAEALQVAAGETLTLNEVNPVWLRPPAAPYVAALIENRLPDVALAREVIAAAAARHSAVVVEGAGGWLVPILQDYTFADLATELGWPVLLVAINRLGALNHILLTLESIRARGLRCVGVVLNHPSVPGPEDEVALATNRQVLETLIPERVWELPRNGVVSADASWEHLFTV